MCPARLIEICFTKQFSAVEAQRAPDPAFAAVAVLSSTGTASQVEGCVSHTICMERLAIL